MFRVLAIAVLTTFSLSAFSIPVYERGQWQLDDSDPANANSGVCAASTAANLGDAPYALSVIVDKAGLRPIEVTIRPFTGPSAATAMTAALSSREVYNFAKLPPTQTGEEILWHIPRSTHKLIDYLKAKSQFRVDSAAGAPGTLKFSLSGSTATLKELERRCAANSLFEAEDFEARFLPPEAAAYDVSLLSPEATSAIRDAVLRAVAAYRELVAAEKQIADLESRYAQLTREARGLTTELARLNEERAGYQTARDQAQAAIDTAIADIARLEAQIVDAQNRQVQAQTDLDAANAALAPFKPEHDRLRGLLSSARRLRERAQTALANLEGAIGTSEQNIAGMQALSEDLRRQVEQLQQESRRAQRQLDDAERDLRDFNVQDEIRRAKEGNWELRNLEDEIQALRGQIQNQRQNLRQAENQRDAKQTAYNQCVQNNPDCSNELAQLQAAQQQVDQSAAQLAGLQQQMQQKQARRDWIVGAIENDVRARRDALANEAQRARANARDVENRLGQTEDRLSNLIRFDLPNEQAHLADLRGQLPGARSDVAAGEAAVDRAHADLDGYDASVGYATLEAAVTAATSAIGAIREEISRAKRDIEQNQTLIRHRTRTRDENDQKLVRVDQKIAPKQARLTEVQALLAPYEQEKGDIDQRLAAANQLLNALKAEFASYLPH